MLKVFLIEDAERIRSLLIEILESTGTIQIAGFAEGQADALRQLREIEWDVAIVDIALREGNGLAVLEALKKDGRNYGVRFVFTNHPSVALRDRSLELGAQAFFDKSREMEQLIEQVQKMAHQ